MPLFIVLNGNLGQVDFNANNIILMKEDGKHTIITHAGGTMSVQESPARIKKLIQEKIDSEKKTPGPDILTE